MGAFGNFPIPYGELHSKCDAVIWNLVASYVSHSILKSRGDQLGEISEAIAVYKSHKAASHAKREKGRKTKIKPHEARRKF